MTETPSSTDPTNTADATADAGLFEITREQILSMQKEALAEDEKPATEIDYKVMKSHYERSIARSHATPQGLAVLFPGLKMAQRVTPDAEGAPN